MSGGCRGKSGHEGKECNVCSKIFAKPAHVKQHLKTHVQKTISHCPQCSSSYIREDKFRQHIKICNMEEVDEYEEQVLPRPVLKICPVTSSTLADTGVCETVLHEE